MLNINANVTIGVTGLAVTYFNTSSDNWEFLFPREVPDHQLKIKIIQYYSDGTRNTWEKAIRDTVKKIEVTSSPSLYEPKPDSKYTFPGEMEDDSLDGRWMLDLSSPEFYGTYVKLKNKKNQKFTFLSIPKGTLYTLAHPSKDDTLDITRNSASHVRRKIAQTAGIDVQWAGNAVDRKTEIKDLSDAANPVSLIPDDFITPKNEVVLYRVILDNDCGRCTQCSQSDFKYYNELLIDFDNMGDVKFEIPALSGALTSEPLRLSLLNSSTATTESLNIGSGYAGCKDVPCFLIETSKTEICGRANESLEALLNPCP